MDSTRSTRRRQRVLTHHHDARRSCVSIRAGSTRTIAFKAALRIVQWVAAPQRNRRRVEIVRVRGAAVATTLLRCAF